MKYTFWQWAVVVDVHGGERDTAQLRGAHTLTEAQQLWLEERARWWPPGAVRAGLGPIRSSREASNPRDGEAGRWGESWDESDRSVPSEQRALRLVPGDQDDSD